MGRLVRTAFVMTPRFPVLVPQDHRNEQKNRYSKIPEPHPFHQEVSLVPWLHHNAAHKMALYRKTPTPNNLGMIVPALVKNLTNVSRWPTDSFIYLQSTSRPLPRQVRWYPSPPRRARKARARRLRR